MGVTSEAGAYRVLREAECLRLLEGLREVGAVTVAEHHDRGGTICERREEWEAFYVLAAGAVKLFRGYPGYRSSKSFMLLLGPWDVFGSAYSAGEAFGWEYAEAATDCEVIRVPRASMERAVRDRPDVALGAITLLDLKLVEYEELLGRILPQSTEVRLAKLLPILADKFGACPGDRPQRIELRLTRGDLAAMVAATRESITTAVRDLCDKRIIEMKGGRVVLLDLEALARVGGR